MSFIYSLYIFSMYGYITNSQVASSQLIAQLVKALHRYRRGDGFEPCSSLDFFFKLHFLDCLSLVHNCNDLSFCLEYYFAFQIYEFHMFTLWENKYMLFSGREIRSAGKNCARGLVPKVLKTSGTVFSHAERPGQYITWLLTALGPGGHRRSSKKKTPTSHGQHWLDFRFRYVWRLFVKSYFKIVDQPKILWLFYSYEGYNKFSEYFGIFDVKGFFSARGSGGHRGGSSLILRLIYFFRLVSKSGPNLHAANTRGFLEHNAIKLLTSLD